MKVLLVGFGRGEGTVSAVAQAVEGTGATIAGWVATPGPAIHDMRKLSRGFPCYEHFSDHGAPPMSWPSTDWFRRVDDSDGFVLECIAWREGPEQGPWHRALRIKRAAARVEEILRDVKPDVIVFEDVPHKLLTYLLFRRAEQLGTRVIMARHGALRHHVHLVSKIEGFMDEVRSAPERQVSTLSPAAEHMLARLQGDYSTARPWYMKKHPRQQNRGERLRYLAGKAVRASPARFVAGALERQRRQSALDAHNKVATQLPATGPVVAVFLHVQPERTTAPDAGFYCDQIEMIEALRAALLPGWNLVVREHPQSFIRAQQVGRFSSLYPFVARDSRVSFASFDLTPFDIIDRATVVATVSGTAGMEAVARGKPTLAFGLAPYEGCHGVYPVRRGQRVDDTLREAANAEGFNGHAALRTFFERMERSTRTFVGPDDWLNDPELLSDSRYFSLLATNLLSALPDN